MGVVKENTSVAECSLSEWARRCAFSSPEALNSPTQNAMMHTQDLVRSETLRSDTLPLSFETDVAAKMGASVADVPKKRCKSNTSKHAQAPATLDGRVVAAPVRNSDRSPQRRGSSQRRPLQSNIGKDLQDKALQAKGQTDETETKMASSKSSPRAPSLSFVSTSLGLHCIVKANPQASPTSAIAEREQLDIQAKRIEMLKLREANERSMKQLRRRRERDAWVPNSAA